MNDSTSFLPGTPGTIEAKPSPPLPIHETEDWHIWPAEVPRPTPHQIIDATCILTRCNKEGLYTDDLKASRRAESVLARHLAAVLCRRIRGMSYPEIALCIGGGHSTYMTDSWAYTFARSAAGIAVFNATLEALAKEQNARLTPLTDSEGKS